MITDISEESDIDMRLREALIDIEDWVDDDLSYLKRLFYYTEESRIAAFRTSLNKIRERYEEDIEAIRKERI